MTKATACRLLGSLLTAALLVSSSIAQADDDVRLASANAAPSPKPSRFEPVTCRPIHTFQLRRDRTTFGKLTFLSGCILNGHSEHFGGFSGLHVSASGNDLYAITDPGYFLSAEILRDGKGHLQGLDQTRLTLLRDTKGQQLSRENHQDLEGFALLGRNGYAASERNHAILPLSWPDETDMREANPSVHAPIPLPPVFQHLGYNQGLEALTLKPGETGAAPDLIAIAEKAPRDPDILPGAILKDGHWTRFNLRRTDRFDATDAAILPNGDLLLLERRFNLRDLLGMRLRRFSLTDLKSGRALEGETLLQADSGYQIDNMEGMSVHQNAQGETILSLISDDNFSLLQRTLLLEFKLTDETPSD